MAPRFMAIGSIAMGAQDKVDPFFYSGLKGAKGGFCYEDALTLASLARFTLIARHV